MNPLQEQMKEVIELQHAQWLEHPVTKAVLKGLSNHAKSFADNITSNAMEKTVPDATIRLNAACLKTMTVAVRIVSDSYVLIRTIENQTIQ